jgi:acyl-CoA reductase-like NAD-dependent aldehyde dehydrogenase
LLLSTIDMIPALLAGCAIIVKPSEITPRFITPIQKTIDAIPELSQVLKYIEGDGLTGSNLIELADLTCFTGSVATGRKVYQKSAELFKPVFLELGGKDAAIILKGANLEKAAKSILWGSCVNNGHSCLSIERVYVDAEVFEAFLKNLVSEVASIRLAYDDPQQGHIGPLISERQVAIINDHLADALAKGALLVTGSTTCELVNGGYYCKPTILTNVNHSMKIMTEETFGPIIPIMGFQSHHEAIFLANDTIFGLSGAVFAETQEKALQLARKMKAGAISINECALTAIVHDGEKNSFNMSGLGGSRMGPTSLQRFMRKKAYLINQNVEDSPWWFSSVNGV